MRHSIKHDLSPDQLKLAVEKFAEVYCERFREYHTTAEWVRGDCVEVRFKVKGIKLAGKLSLLPKEIGIDMEVPLALRLFRSRALQAIEEEVRPWLERAARGDLA